MINIRTLKKLKENDGLTLKNGKVIEYKTGWQVAVCGVETRDINEVRKYIKQYNGTCGLWLSGGVWYVDKSFRVDTKREALEIGRECKQISVFCWRNKNLTYC